MRAVWLIVVGVAARSPSPSPSRAVEPTVPLVLPPSSTTSVMVPTVPVVSPLPSPTTAVDAPAADASGQLRVDSHQPGVTLAVDGQAQTSLPVELHLDPGTHTLQFSGDRYQTLERRVTIVTGQTVDLGDVRLPVVRGMVTIILATPGARVLLIHGSQRHEVPTMPISVDFDTRKQWVLHATLSGYCEMVEPIDFSDGTAKKTIEVKLVAGCGH